MKVYVTRRIPEAAIKLLREKGFQVSVFEKDYPVPKKILLEKTKNADAVISLLTDKFDSDVIDNMNKCKVIANYAVGYNNIDIAYAKQKGITVTNTPDVLTDATADLTMTFVLACARRVAEGEKIVRSKKFTGWKPQMLLGIELKNKKFGILGAGRIGTAVAKRAAAFGTKIIYYDNKNNKLLEEETSAKKVSLKRLLKEADFVSIHLPLTDKTFHLLNKENLTLLKRSAILINTARGEIIDEKVLINMLEKKKIFAAGFDVYENEPDINPKLLKLENVVLLPHIGSATIETRNEMALLAAKNVIAVLSGKKPVTPVN